jgi:hypothetical protein
MKPSKLSRINKLSEEYFMLALKHQDDEEKLRVFDEKHVKYIRLFYDSIKIFKK